MDQEVEAPEEPQRVQECRAELQLYQELLTSRGWVELVEAAKKQMHARRAPYLRGPIQDGNIYKQQYELGEAAGIELFINIPQVVIDSCRAIIEEHTNANTTAPSQS